MYCLCWQDKKATHLVICVADKVLVQISANGYQFSYHEFNL